MNSDQKIAHIAQKVMNRAKIINDPQYGEIITILMIISIILTAIRALQECNKNKLKDVCVDQKPIVYGSMIKDLSTKKTWFTRRRIKKIIAQKLNRKNYIQYSVPLTEAILSIGENVTDDEITTLLEKANA